MEKLSELLLCWYDLNKRDLPWRNNPTPYQTWVSEIMLQQTRVEAVRAYYERFMNALPDVKALAEAPEDQYMKLWEGLGYYSRVRNLHKAAVVMEEQYGGKLPETAAELQKLPGIGPYTSAAIAAISFRERIPAIDGNLLRVFSRMEMYGENIKGDTAKSEATLFYQQMLDVMSDDRAGDFNQALMDLGATVCLPNSTPLCDRCPWKERCKAHAAGKEMDFPVMPAKKARKMEQYTVLIIRYTEHIAIRKRSAKGLLAGLYEFPNIEGHLSENEVIAYVHALGFQALRIRRLRDGKHIFSHKEWNMIGYEVYTDELRAVPKAKTKEEIFLATPEEIEKEYSIPSAFAVYQEYI